MKIYLVRHGETAFNAEKKYLGQTDCPLTDNGIKQSQLVAEKLKKFNIDLIYFSPIKRAEQTAQIINKYLEKPSFPLDHLVEWKMLPTRFEGMTASEIGEQNIKLIKNDDDVIFDDAESFSSLIKRCRHLIDHLKTNHINDSILIVTHDNFCRALFGLIFHKESFSKSLMADLIDNISLDHTGISLLEYSKTRLTNKEMLKLIFWNLT